MMPDTLLATVLVASTLIQFAAAYLVFRLNWCYGRQWPWSLISASLLVMALRRSITLYRFLSPDGSGLSTMWADGDPLLLPQSAVSLAASVLMLAGVALIEPLFRRMVESETQMQAANSRLQAQVHQHEFSMRLAGEIQAGRRPDAVPLLNGVDVAGVSLPAESVGGDVYDYVLLPDRHLAVMIADVSGHGVGPALLMTEVRAYFRALTEAHRSLAECLKRANRFLATDMGTGRFITAFCARIHPQAWTLTYAAAGHEAYLIGSGGGLTRLTTNDLPLGLDADLHYAHGRKVRLEPGEILVLMTDGIGEAATQDGALFGEDRAIKIVQENRHLPAAAIIAILLREVQEFSAGPAQDDRTIVIVKFPSSQKSTDRANRRRRSAFRAARGTATRAGQGTTSTLGAIAP